MSDRVAPHVRTFLAQRLRALRLDRRLSQTQLAQRAGLSGKFIGEVERGEKSISIDSLYRVSAALRVPLALLTDVGRSPGSVPPADAERIFGIVARGHSPATLRRAYAVLRTMLNERHDRRGGAASRPSAPRRSRGR